MGQEKPKISPGTPNISRISSSERSLGPADISTWTAGGIVRKAWQLFQPKKPDPEGESTEEDSLSKFPTPLTGREVREWAEKCEIGTIENREKGILILGLMGNFGG